MDDIRQAIQEIHEDHRSGAAELAARACGLLSSLAQEATAESFDEWRGRLQEVARSLVQAQPSMAPMVNLANAALWAIEDARSLDESQSALQEAMAGCRKRAESAQEEITRHLSRLLPDGAYLLTHSRSSTLLQALLALWRQGRRFAVICTESRPLNEGRTLAESLGAAGIEVTLVVDAAAFGLLHQVALALVGADSISREGLMNKIGTAGLACAAKRAGVPFCACCETAKLVPQGYEGRIKIVEQPPEEVWESPPPGVKPLSFYFDVTPLQDLTGVVTERGILAGDELLTWLASREVHPALLEGV